MNQRSRAYHIRWTCLMLVVIAVQTVITNFGPMPVEVRLSKRSALFLILLLSAALWAAIDLVIWMVT